MQNRTSTQVGSSCFAHLPDEVVNHIGRRLEQGRDIVSLCLTEKRIAKIAVREPGGFLNSRAPELIERKLECVRSTSDTERPAAAAKFLLSLGPQLRTIYVDAALRSLPEEKETATFFMQERSSRVAGACLLAPGKTRNEDVIQHLQKKVLQADNWDEYEIPDIPSNVIDTFGAERTLARDALSGLWRAYTLMQEDDSQTAKFASAICKAMRTKMKPPSVSLLVRIVASPRLKNAEKSIQNLELPQLAEQLTPLETDAANRQFKRLVKGLPHLDARSKEELLQYLHCFACLLPRDGKLDHAGIDWLQKIIALALKKGATRHEIRSAIPAGIFRKKGRAYLVHAVDAGEFSVARLRSIEKKKNPGQ